MKASKSLIQRTSSSLVPLAVAGLLAGLSACGEKPAETKTEPKPAVESSKSAAPAAKTPAASAEKHACAGKNACKGQGGCKTSDNGCKGKNSCKGKGGCESK